ncbi:alcohol dehydrogenase catalytic domain-containing protein [Rathayibacter sp. VKM Ac-2856]|nr:alcohol dehydrogenase catalytic domain-containing protein [Rathayibacter sp. VKM Ac-2858]NQX18533.1 alcohol dehydrogenase catalytic domain-containing protein [Rathayibacter sp. VKM Ac-2856]
MTGAAYTGKATIELIQTPRRAPADGEVEIAIAFCGLCGTDLHIVHGDMDARVSKPHVFGHEMSGVVSRVGAGVTEWASGDRVSVMPLLWDGICSACLDGHQHICRNLTFLGVDSPGALQQHWIVPAKTLVRLPDGLDLRTAALVEPTAVAVHDVRRSGLAVGDKVVILGGGPIGLLIASVARHAGASVLLSEVDEGRRARIAALGFEVLDALNADVPLEVDRWTGGEGADVVFEVSGAAAAVRQTTALAKVRGTIVVVAIHAAPREIDLQRVFWRELRLLGARVYQRSDIERAITLLSEGALPAEALITDVVPLADTAAAVERLTAGSSMKVLVDVGGTEGGES